MAIDIRTKCDKCNGTLSDGDEVYCLDCWEEAQATIETLQEEINNLQARLAEMEA